MYLNIFKLKWLSPDILKMLKQVSDSYTIYASTHQCKKIPIKNLKGNERWIKSLTILIGDNILVYDVDGRMTLYNQLKYENHLNLFMLKHKTCDSAFKSELMSDTISTLKIDNNIDHNEHNITYHLNDYTSEERKRLLKYLANIDENSIDVSIHMDLSNATEKQLQYHQDNLMLSTIE